ncbi:hypothetical protein RSAG8_11277, partial [Rhizoctonia solani AG-8 WAC10335]
MPPMLRGKDPIVFLSASWTWMCMDIGYLLDLTMLWDLGPIYELLISFEQL